MIGSRKLVVGLALLGGIASAVGCSGMSDSAGNEQGGNEIGEAGMLALALNVGDDVTLHTVDWDIAGPHGFSKSGHVNVRRSRDIRFQVGGLPAGNGFEIVLHAVGENDERITCTGSAQFDISAGETTTTTVTLTCRMPRRNGSVLVNGELNLCPWIDEVTVLPTQVAVGGTIELTGSAIDEDGVPSPLTYQWSAMGGELSASSGPGVTLTCVEPGTIELTFTADDGDCTDVITTSVECTEPEPDGGASVDAGAEQDSGVEGEAILLWNEVESNGGTPDDWSELYNAGNISQDLSGWIFRDNDDSPSHAYTIPAGTVIEPGEYLILEGYGFGLGTNDAVRLFTPELELVAQYNWGPHAPTTYGRCPDVTGDFGITTTPTKGAPNDCSPVVVFNEVESNGDPSGDDWVEVYNSGFNTADLSGWTFKDGDDANAYVLPPGSTLLPGQYFILEQDAFGFGLGGSESVRLYNLESTLTLTYSWASHATTTYGRCPNGSGDFATTVASTKGAANSCPLTAQAWPGGSAVQTVDPAGAFPSNLSGLTHQPASPGNPAVLWGALNAPSKIYRLTWDGVSWAPEAGAWAAGKTITYPSGTGQPDTEGVTKAEWNEVGIYVATERDNNLSSTSRLAVLRLDETSPTASLTASHEWNLTAQLPAVGANLGLEAITWIPDSYLTTNGFFDELLGHTYNPLEYANHGTGLFVVGVEGTGVMYALALNHVTSTASIVATISSGFPGVMGLEFDRDSNYLWAWCDDTCGNQATILQVDVAAGSPTLGRLIVKRKYDHPSGLPSSNFEGFAIQPHSECSGGFKGVFWADDSNIDNHAIRQGTIPCGSLF